MGKGNAPDDAPREDEGPQEKSTVVAQAGGRERGRGRGRGRGSDGGGGAKRLHRLTFTMR